MRNVEGILYCYVNTANAKYARTRGRKDYGNISNYINYLIANDRGVKPARLKRKPKQ